MTNLLTNGSFEGSHTGPVYGTAPPGWYNVEGSSDLNRNFGGTGDQPATDGDDWAYVVGGNSYDEVFGQVLATPLTGGNMYTFSIDADGELYGSATGTAGDALEIRDQSGNVLASFIPSNWATDGYESYSATFVAPPGVTEIHIAAFGPSNHTLWAVDNAVLTEARVAPCFTPGTLIQTEYGHKPIEDLSQGDLVMTRDHGLQPIRWIGSQSLSAQQLDASPNMKPIRISAGAVGKNMPQQDLVVSPQHRMLVRSKVAERMFEETEVLVAAKHLLEMDGIDVQDDAPGVEYFHMMFDQHEIVYANGAETESLFTGPEAIKSLSQDARNEILSLFPMLSDIDYVATAARKLVKGRLGRSLASRHLRNQKELVAALH